MSEEWRSYEHTGYCWTCDGRTLQLSHGGGGADRSDGGKAFGRTGCECKDRAARLFSGNRTRTCASIGGGRIRICEIDGLTANFSGEAPTLVVYNQDKPGCIVKVTSRLGEAGINIATMQVYRDERGGHAVMVIEVDQEVPRERIAALEQEEGIEKVIYLCLEE